MQTIDNVEKLIEVSDRIHRSRYTYDDVTEVTPILQLYCREHQLQFDIPLIDHFGIVDHKAKGCPMCNYVVHIRDYQIKDIFPPKRKRNASIKSQKWLKFLNINGLVAEKALHISDNKYIFADGYNPATKTIYEFHGDYWHGNLDKFNPHDIHPHFKIPFSEVRVKSDNRDNRIRSSGFNLVIMWESEWDTIYS